MHLYILWTLSVIEIALAIFVLKRYQRSRSIYSLVGLILGFSLMSFFVGGLFLSVADSTLLLFGKLAFLAGLVIFVSLLMLSIFYPIPSGLKETQIRWLLFLPLLLFTPYILFYRGFIASISMSDGAATVVTGSGFWVFTLFGFGYCISAVYLIWKKLRHLVNEQLHETKTFLLVVLIAGILGFINDFLLSIFNIRHNPAYGTETAFLVILVISSIVLKK